MESAPNAHELHLAFPVQPGPGRSSRPLTLSVTLGPDELRALARVQQLAHRESRADLPLLLPYRRGSDLLLRADGDTLALVRVQDGPAWESAPVRFRADVPDADHPADLAELPGAPDEAVRTLGAALTRTFRLQPERQSCGEASFDLHYRAPSRRLDVAVTGARLDGRWRCSASVEEWIHPDLLQSEPELYDEADTNTLGALQHRSATDVLLFLHVYLGG